MKRTRKKPPPTGEVRKPAHWERRVSAAYLRLTGHTQKETAKGAGLGLRTVRDYERHPSWPFAEAEARSRWLNHGDALTMRALHHGLENNDQATARFWAQKRIRELGGAQAPRGPGTSRPGDYGILLTAEQLRAMSDEQLAALDAALALASGDPAGGDPGADPSGDGAEEG